MRLLNAIERSPVLSCLFYWALTALWIGVIWHFSAQPYSGRITEHFFGSFNVLIRKIGHVSEYAILFWLSKKAIVSNMVLLNQPKASKLGGLLALFFAFASALIDEWHQSYVPGRSASLFDVGVDSLGIGLGFIFCAVGFRRFR